MPLQANGMAAIPIKGGFNERTNLSFIFRFSVSEPPALLSEKHETVYLPQSLSDVPPTVLLVGCCVKRVFTASVVNVCPLEQQFLTMTFQTQKRELLIKMLVFQSKPSEDTKSFQMIFYLRDLLF